LGLCNEFLDFVDDDFLYFEETSGFFMNFMKMVMKIKKEKREEDEEMEKILVVDGLLLDVVDI
jgi:uncharacterized protein (UPF0335 family)